jgi:hypothetical protein
MGVEDRGIRPGTKPKLLEKLKVAAERCCVVQQTLRLPSCRDDVRDVLIS